MSIRMLRRLMILPTVLAIAWVSHGCDTIGAMVGVVASAVPRHVDAAYKGLAGQPCVIVVWVDRGVRMDYPDLQVDLAAGLQNKLIEVQAADHPDALKLTQFPVTTNKIVAYQTDHPELENEPITETAKRFVGTRLIYLAVTEFTVHSTMSQELYRGKMTVDLKVVEVIPDKIHPEDPKMAVSKEIDLGTDVSVVFPKESPTDGLPIGTESTITQGTMKAMIEKIAQKFYDHNEDRD